MSSSSFSFNDPNCATTSFQLDRVKQEVQDVNNENTDFYISKENNLAFNKDFLKDTSKMSTNEALLAAVSVASTSANCMFFEIL